MNFQSITEEAALWVFQQVFSRVDGVIDAPDEFWKKLAAILGRVTAAIIKNGGRPEAADLSPFGHEIQALMRRYELIDTV